MSFDIICLVAEWEQAVAACREARGDDFYWGVDEEAPLPYAEEHWYRGYAFTDVGWYYEKTLRPHLSAASRDPTDLFIGSLYHLGDGTFEPPDDLCEDVGIELADYQVHYSMRPATVQKVLTYSGSVPWPEIENIASRVPRNPEVTRYDIADFAHFTTIMSHHQSWLEEAAETGRGLILLVSQ